jgi:polyphosphate kinase
MYIASADFMTRNTERRVEVACPIYSSSVKEKLRHILDIELSDTVKARMMISDGSYMRLDGDGVDSQRVLMEEAKESEAPERVEGFLRAIIRGFLQG